MDPKMTSKSSSCAGGLREGLRERFWRPQGAPQRLPGAPRERQESPRRAPGAPQEAQSEPQEAKNELQEGQNEPQEGSGGPKRLRVTILVPPDVVFGRFPLDFHRFHARPAQERGDRDALPPQTPGVGREAAEQGRRRSYGLAVSILGRLSPLSPCFCSLSCRSCSCCSCRSLCSRLTCIACTLSGLSRFPFHDSQVSFWGCFRCFFSNLAIF